MQINELNNLAEYRLARGLSQKQLADAVGVSRISISNYETGKFIPKMDILIRICQLLSVPASELYPQLERQSV